MRNAVFSSFKKSDLDVVSITGLNWQTSTLLYIKTLLLLMLWEKEEL
jgi:hypothetical protein